MKEMIEKQLPPEIRKTHTHTHTHTHTRTHRHTHIHTHTHTHNNNNTHTLTKEYSCIVPKYICMKNICDF